MRVVLFYEFFGGYTTNTVNLMEDAPLNKHKKGEKKKKSLRVILQTRKQRVYNYVCYRQ